MADGLADDLGERLDDSDSDWDLADPLISDLDLTEPTAPILAPRPASRPARRPSLREPPFRPQPAVVAAAPAATSLPRQTRRGTASPKPAPPAEPPSAPVVATASPVVSVAPDAAPVAAMPRVVLSKFRHADALASGAASDAARSEVGADRSAELARIPIVRVRREAEKKVPFLARLLSSF